MWKFHVSAQARMSHQGATLEEGVLKALEVSADSSAACKRMHSWGSLEQRKSSQLNQYTTGTTGWTLLPRTQDEENSFPNAASLSQDLTRWV